MPALATTVYLAGFFAEDKSGAIRHSAMSAVFLRDPGMGDTARLMFDVDVRAYSRFGDSIRLDPMGLKIRDGPTALAFQSSVDGKGNRPTIWEIMERDPIQQIRFHSMMQTLGAFPSHLLKHVLSAFDWNTIGTLVDVGGSLGHVSPFIAEAFPTIRITVQDLQEVVEKGHLSLPAAPHAERITLQTQDFFHVQETVADAYLLWQILHDWPDEDAERIVKKSVPALRPGARILVMDIIVPKPDMISPYIEKYLRTYDVSTFSMFSGKERTLSHLRDTVERCDVRLQFEGMTCPRGSAATLLSWVYLAN